MGRHHQDASHQSGGDQRSAGTIKNILKWERQQHGQGIDTEAAQKPAGQHRASGGESSNIRSHRK